MANFVNIKETKISIGDIAKLTFLIKEDNKERLQVFEGRVISIKGREPNKTIILRRMGVDNIGVERIFFVNSPIITKVEIKKSIPERRAKLYNLRLQK